MRLSKAFLSLSLMAIALLFTAGCSTIDPATGVKAYDPIKTEQVKAAVAPVVTGSIRAVIANNPRHRDELGNYFRSVGTVFCKMVETRSFEPVFLITEVNKLTAPAIARADPLLLTGKDSAIAIYRIFYAEKHRAEFDESSWPLHVADTLCLAFDTALKDSGLPGVR